MLLTFSQGLYHLRILLPPTYPMSAPDIILMTPNGRFELGKKVSLDHPSRHHNKGPRPQTRGWALEIRG